EVADDEGMALSPAEIAEGLGEAGGAAATAAAPRHTAALSSAKPKAAQADDSIDLGATVLPVILKSYAPHIIGALVAIAFGYALGRRRR
ncbi:MAG TPA: carbon monoxide dehydrogenase, partial [Phycicoccus sp.]|nr:carbon monoxide dehydrogenase [Phycicoccus sp.]